MHNIYGELEMSLYPFFKEDHIPNASVAVQYSHFAKSATKLSSKVIENAIISGKTNAEIDVTGKCDEYVKILKEILTEKGYVCSKISGGEKEYIGVNWIDAGIHTMEEPEPNKPRGGNLLVG
jgi:hypothetical protein